MKIAILILTHNAPRYTIKTFRSLRRTAGIDYEVICVDNASRWTTRAIVMAAFWLGYIDRLCLSKTNTFFAGGNNLAARLASRDATHFLLLNSDVEIRHKDWLAVLVRNHQRGLTSFGTVETRSMPRLDGYCLLADRDLYERFGLDESFQWFWAVTKLQALALEAGFTVRGFRNHERYLHHFGGKSGKAFKVAKGMSTPIEEVRAWFDQRHVSILDNPAE